MIEYSKQFQFLKHKFDSGNLAHAYILAGGDHTAKKAFANNLIEHINCKFPDVITIASAASESSVKNEKDMMEIDIGQIRQLQHFLSYKSYYGGHKAVIVENADRMNTEAQNCLLKNLEEPKGDTLILLLTNTAEMLLPTISSRCQVVKFTASTQKSAEINAELRGILEGDLAEKFKYAKAVNLEGDNFQNILQGLQRYFRNLDVIKYARVLKFILDLERQDQISNLNKKLALKLLLLEILYQQILLEI